MANKQKELAKLDKEREEAKEYASHYPSIYSEDENVSIKFLEQLKKLDWNELSDNSAGTTGVQKLAKDLKERVEADYPNVSEIKKFGIDKYEVIVNGYDNARGSFEYNKENIEDMIFYKNILDSLILSKIVSSFEDINEKELVSFGASQGGAFSIIFSALNKNVTKCISLYPFLADFQNNYEKDNRKNAYSEFTHHARWFNTRGQNTDTFLNNLFYLDTLNFAKLLKCNVLFGISNLDEDCPKETQEKIYYNIKSQKKLCLYKKYYHENIPNFNNEIVNFLLKEK